MKSLLILFLGLIALAAYSQEGICISNSVITGDFDGNGITETLNYFLADSLGNRIAAPVEIEGETWHDYVYNFGKAGYQMVIALPNSATPPLTYPTAESIDALYNVGNLNSTPGDEKAVIPGLADHSRHSYCHIYSLCNDTWQEVFVFNVHEDSLDKAVVYSQINGVLERRNGKWVYYDYLDMEYENPEDVGSMLPLKVPGCE